MATSAPILPVEDIIHSDGTYDYIQIEPHHLIHTLNYPIKMVSNNSNSIISNSSYTNTFHLPLSSSPSSTFIPSTNRSRSSSAHSNSSSNNNSPRRKNQQIQHSVNYSSSHSPPLALGFASFQKQQENSLQQQQEMAPTFIGQLPLPPGCNLFKQLSLSEKRNTKYDTKGKQNFQETNEKICVRIGLTKKEGNSLEKETLPQAIKPYNSVKLFENSLGYTYEDHWNVEEFRPLLSRSLVSPFLEKNIKELSVDQTIQETISTRKEEFPSICTVTTNIPETVTTTATTIPSSSSAEDATENCENTNDEIISLSTSSVEDETEAATGKDSITEKSTTSTVLEQPPPPPPSTSTTTTATELTELTESTEVNEANESNSTTTATEQQVEPVVVVEGNEPSEPPQFKWKHLILEKYPVIQELQERLHPLWRTLSFGELYNAGQKQVRENLTDEIILNIIMQHLRFEGLKQTRTALEEETQRKYLDIDVQQSLFHALSKESIKKTERLHDLVIFDKSSTAGVNIQKQSKILKYSLEERLIDLGINEFGIDSVATSSENQRELAANNRLSLQLQHQQINEIVHIDPVSKYEQFQAGTLNRIIEKLVTCNNDNQSITSTAGMGGSSRSQFVDVFLHTYLSLFSSESVLNRIIHKYKTVPPPNKNHYLRRMDIQIGILNFLHYWMEQHGQQHFTNNMLVKVEQLLKQQNSTLEDENNNNHSSPSSSPSSIQSLKFNKIRNDIVQLIQQLHNDGVNKEKNNLKMVVASSGSMSTTINYIEPKVPMQKIFCSTLSLDDIDEEELAKQLTLYEHDLFVGIGLEELMSFGWKRSKFRHRSPNVIKLLNHSEAITQWISYSLCRPKSKNSSYKRCITICEHLRKLNNFQTLKSILNAFEFGEVKTLKIGQHEQLIKSKLLEESNYYQENRQTLKEIATEYSIIPHVKASLTDLYLIEENQNDYTIGPSPSIELVNWMKRESMYDIVKEIKYFQSLPCYPFTKVYQIQELIRNCQQVD